MLGYWGEPYLRFNSDGTVEENRRSPTVAENESRYGGSSTAGRRTRPVSRNGREVATDGSYAWHDHRAHWMSTEPPAGERGDEVLTGVIPLQVDGADVRGLRRGDLGAGAVAGAARRRRRGRRLRRDDRALDRPSHRLGAGHHRGGGGRHRLVAGRLGAPETGPSSISWLLPAIAAVGGDRRHHARALAGVARPRHPRRDCSWRCGRSCAATGWSRRCCRPTPRSGSTVASPPPRRSSALAGIAAGVLGMLRLPAAEG